MTYRRNNIKSKNSNSNKDKKSKNNMQNEIPSKRVIGFLLGVILLFISIFLLIAFTSFLLSGQEDIANLNNNTGIVKNACGKFGLWASNYMINDLFGIASFFIPFFLLLVGLNLMGSYKFKLFKVFIYTSFFMIWLSFVLSVLAPETESYVSLGGKHGRTLQTMLGNIIGPTGLYLLIIISIVSFLVFFSSKTIDFITKLFRFSKLKKIRLKSLAEKLHNQLLNSDDKNESTKTIPSDPTTFDDPSVCSITFDEKGNVIIDEPNSQDDEIQHDSSTESLTDHEDNNHLDLNSTKDVQLNNDDTNFVIEDITNPEKSDGLKDRGSIETDFDPKLDLEYYKYPPLSLLKSNNDSNPHIDKKEQIENQDRIKHVLKSFGVEISSIRATIGPTITLYEITPAEGVRITKIRNLEDDIALSLAAEGIRIIAPIPGKGTIGIEVPNKKKCIVSMESVLNSRTYQESTMELPCVLGKTITNDVFMVDLAKAPHMLVAGATGMGKSVGLNAIVTSLLYKKHPSELKIVMVDPKKVEFSVYSPIANQFLAKLEDEEDAIITENDRVVKTLKALCKLMDDRYLLLKRANVRNIKEYNELFKHRKLNPLEGHNYMPYYVVIIDEFGDLIMTAGKEVELPICRIAQLARAVGIHMIIATQRPTTNIITGTIKANFPARIAFRVTSGIDSKIILDRTGANQLIGRGDMLYLQNADPVRVQCAFVDTPEVKKIVQYISEQQQFPEMTYLPEPPTEDGDGGSKDVDMNNLDPMFGEVAKMIVSQNVGSTSLIQRKFSIGYNRAGRLMDQLERAGIVGPQQGSKPREVLITDFITLDSILKSFGINA